MRSTLRVSIGQYSTAGRKAENQDAVGFQHPKEPMLSTKGVALALADGISSSDVSRAASESAIHSFLKDYYCTSDAWTVKTSGERVLQATNSALCAQSQRAGVHLNRDQGYVCTFSALIFKENRAHCFHIGDSRIYRVLENGLEQLTKDHRLIVSAQQSYLAKALGAAEQAEIDYDCVTINAGDTFLIMTDGVYEFMEPNEVLQLLNDSSLSADSAAQQIVEHALQRGSQDNLSIQIAYVESIPTTQQNALKQQLEQLPLPPALEPPQPFDGYQIERQLYQSSRSHVYLATHIETGEQVALKTPSVSAATDPLYLERFLMEEWIARRINSPHVVKAGAAHHQRQFIYTVSKYVEGQTLTQWITDHPQPTLNEVRNILEQVATGLRAFHRMEMLHQDLKPDNIIIDSNGTVKIIDFGSTEVLALVESDFATEHPALLGTALYSAPEYFLGEYGSYASDQYSLGVLAYFMLSGEYPYGTNVPKATNPAAQRRLRYRSVRDDESNIPAWIDAAIRRATQVNPLKRYPDISEFIYDLKHPNQHYLNQTRQPLMERNPVRFWQTTSALLFLCLIVVIAANQGAF